jgi:hypothetical protein
VVHYLCAIYALIYLAKVPSRILFFAMICYLVAALLLPNVCRLKLRIYFDISNSTCGLGVIYDLIMWI